MAAGTCSDVRHGYLGSLEELVHGQLPVLGPVSQNTAKVDPILLTLVKTHGLDHDAFTEHILNTEV